MLKSALKRFKVPARLIPRRLTRLCRRCTPPSFSSSDSHVSDAPCPSPTMNRVELDSPSMTKRRRKTESEPVCYRIFTQRLPIDWILLREVTMATNINAEALNESPMPEQVSQNKQTVDPYNVRKTCHLSSSGDFRLNIAVRCLGRWERTGS